MDLSSIVDYVTSLTAVELSHPFSKTIDVYSVNQNMFLLITLNVRPLKISLRCDAQLSKLLRDKYETVMSGHHLNSKYWITVLLTGQLSWPEVRDLIRHSYELATVS